MYDRTHWEGRRQVGISNSCAGKKSIPGEWGLARNRLVGNRRRLVYSRVEARHQVLDAPSLHYRITRSKRDFVVWNARHSCIDAGFKDIESIVGGVPESHYRSHRAIRYNTVSLTLPTLFRDEGFE